MGSVGAGNITHNEVFTFSYPTNTTTTSTTSPDHHSPYAPQDPTMRNLRLFTGSAHPELTAHIAERLGVTISPATLKRFSNQETSINLGVSVRDKDVFIVQSGSSHINDHLMEMLIMISACKGASAKRITAVMPYFPYTKQSKRKGRCAISAKLVANMLAVAGVDHIITMDLHSSQMQGFFNRPVDNLYAEPSIAKYIMEKIPDYTNGVVISKNAGGAKRVTSLADRLKIDFALIHREKFFKDNIQQKQLQQQQQQQQALTPGAAEKSTSTNFPSHANGNVFFSNGESSTDDESVHSFSSSHISNKTRSTELRLTLVGDVKDKPCFIVDDIIDDPHSFLDAAQHLKVCEASSIYIVAAHGILSRDALKQIDECDAVDQIIVTNTYPISEAKRKAFSKKLRVIDVSGVLAEAIRRTHNGESISYLFHTAI